MANAPVNCESSQAVTSPLQQLDDTRASPQLPNKFRKTDTSGATVPHAKGATRVICISDDVRSLVLWKEALSRSVIAAKAPSCLPYEELSVTNDACWDGLQNSHTNEECLTRLAARRLKSCNLQHRGTDGTARYGRMTVLFNQKESIRGKTHAVVHIVGLATSVWNKKLPFLVQFTTGKYGSTVIANLEEAKLLTSETTQSSKRQSEEELVLSSISKHLCIGFLGSNRRAKKR